MLLLKKVVDQLDVHVTSSTFITLHQLNYQHTSKLNIKLIKINILSSIGKFFALLSKAIVVFEILVTSR